MRHTLALAVLVPLVAACAAPGTGTGEGGFLTSVPEGVVEIAAPYQDLSAVRIMEGCYWYRHEGPVETTMLPLRTRDLRPICAQ